jgi:hypothetical protein
MSKPVPKLLPEQLQDITGYLPSQEIADQILEDIELFHVQNVEPKVTATQELQQSIALDLQCEDKAVGELLGE